MSKRIPNRDFRFASPPWALYADSAVEFLVCRDGEELSARAAELVRARVADSPGLALAAPAGRSPRGMYRALAERQRAEPVDFSRLLVFGVDEMCPPAPPDGCLWEQVRRDFLLWAGVPTARWRPFRIDAVDPESMCRDYEAAIAGAGGLDLVVLGLGPNGHIAGNEPGSAFDSRTRPVKLWAESLDYLRSDDVLRVPVSDQAVTLGIGTILEAREVVLLVGGAAKRGALRRLLDGAVTPDLPASALRRHPRCTVLADRAVAP